MSEQIEKQYFHEDSRDIPVFTETDVLVIGGGPAGVCAAAASSAAGIRTMLIEKSGCLGGMWTSGLVITLGAFHSWLEPYQRCVGGFGWKWVNMAAERGWAENHNGWALNSDPEGMKLTADEMLTEAGVEVLLHTLFVAPIKSGNRVKGCIIENGNGRSAILARNVVDCTGNADVAFRTGVPCVKPDECQPMTLGFRLAGLDNSFRNDHKPSRLPVGPEPGWIEGEKLSRYSTLRQDVRINVEEMNLALKDGRLPSFGGPWFGGYDDNIIWVNATRIRGDASDAVQITEAEIRGRKEARAIADYMRCNVAGAEDAVMVQTGNQIGIRETRRIIGIETVKEDDIHHQRALDNPIGYGCWPLDVHKGDSIGMHPMYIPSPYPVPKGSLIPRDIEGLVIAGRCISSERNANGSLRVGGTCCVTGHAAGVIAALSSKLNIPSADVPYQSVREILIDQDAVIEL